MGSGHQVWRKHPGVHVLPPRSITDTVRQSRTTRAIEQQIEYIYSQTSSPSANHMNEAVVNIVRLLTKNATAQLITRAWRTTEGCINEQTHFEWTAISKPQDGSTALTAFQEFPYTVPYTTRPALGDG